jgi:hypothetical protein
MTMSVLLQRSRYWTITKGAQNGALNPALLYLKKMNDKNEKGWLRKAEVDKVGCNVPMTEYRKEGHLSQTEKQLRQRSSLSSLSCNPLILLVTP